jgi:hypothetical protein
VLLWTVAALAVGAAALLSVPVELLFDIRHETAWRATMRLRWMFGLLNVPIAGGKHPGKKAPKRTQTKRKKRRGRPRLLGMILDAGFRRRFARFVRDVLAALRPRDLWLRLRLGLDDPAETGMLWAAVGPLASWAPARLDVAPVFPGPAFDLASHGRVRLIPAQMLGLIAGFALSPAIIGAALRQWRRA